MPSASLDLKVPNCSRTAPCVAGKTNSEMIVPSTLGIQRESIRDTKSLTTSSSCSKIVMLESESTFWAMTRVFFKLMVSPKSWKAFPKRFMSCWRSSAEWAVMAASSAKKKSRRHLLHLDFALSLERLKSFNFRLTYSGDRCPLLQVLFQQESEEIPK